MDILKDDMLQLASNFHKIIEVNLAENTYYVVKVDRGERVLYCDVMHWAEALIKAEYVYPKDVDRFVDFFKSFSDLKKFSRKQILYYRRKIDGDWKMVCTEVVPMKNYSEDDPIALILVREVDRYIEEYYNQILAL